MAVKVLLWHHDPSRPLCRREELKEAVISSDKAQELLHKYSLEALGESLLAYVTKARAALGPPLLKVGLAAGLYCLSCSERIAPAADISAGPDSGHICRCWRLMLRQGAICHT